MLSRRWIINYVLIILILVFSYIGNRYQVQPGYQAVNRIIQLEADQINSITIETPQELLSLQRSGDGWSLESPIQWPANNTNIKRLLSITNQETESRLESDEVDLSALGLQFPKASLRLNDIQIVFGATNNIGGRRYLLIDSTVYLVSDIHLPFISQGLTGLVDRRLLPESITLKSLKLPGWTLQRDSNGDWQLDSDVQTIGPPAELIKNWQGLEATVVKRFKSNATPRQKFTAFFEDGQQQEFFLMSIDPEIVIANPRIGMQYHFSADHYYHLISLRKDENSG
jgi:hypothetical protein